jgi:tRNA threonylcarbamoyladenosine biosynthesis protein TsaB
MNKLLPMLAVESSGELCSICIMEDENTFWEINARKKYIHSEKIFSMIDSVFNLSDLKVNDLKSIAVSMGPGSFTGLRIGLSAVKGIALGAKLPIIPVQTFDAMAYRLSTILPVNSQFAIANSVNTTELYFETFKLGEPGRYLVVDDLQLVKKDDLSLKVSDGVLLFGDSSKKEFNGNYSYPNAESVAKWAYIFGKDLVTFDYDFLEPNYLKKFIAKVKK